MSSDIFSTLEQSQENSDFRFLVFLIFLVVESEEDPDPLLVFIKELILKLIEKISHRHLWISDFVAHSLRSSDFASRLKTILLFLPDRLFVILLSDMSESQNFLRKEIS